MRRNTRKIKYVPAVVLVTAAALVFLSRPAEKPEDDIHATPASVQTVIPASTPAVTPSPVPTPAPTPEPTPEPKRMPDYTAYGPDVTEGSVRYVAQLLDVEKNGWGKYAWKAGMECTTACISMALSYLGIDESPEALLDFSSRTYLGSSYGIEDVEVSEIYKPYPEEGELYSMLQDMTDLYMNDTEGIYSPVLLYLGGNTHNHAILIIWREGETYTVLDPTPEGLHTVRIDSEGRITTDEEEYLTRYIPDDESYATIENVGQWKLKLD